MWTGCSGQREDVFSAGSSGHRPEWWSHRRLCPASPGVQPPPLPPSKVTLAEHRASPPISFLPQGQGVRNDTLILKDGRALEVVEVSSCWAKHLVYKKPLVKITYL